MVSPTATCEIAFATDPGSTPTWVDVTAYLQGFAIQRGRQMELNRVEAGTATVLLDNRDRRFDPSNAASPYAPNVVPVRRVRLSATYNAVTYRLFSGYIETWPPTYPSPLDSDVQITAVDAFKVYNLKQLPGGYPALVLGDSPVGYWRLAETTGTSAADSSTNANNGTYTGGFTLGQTSALSPGDGDAAVLLNGTTGYVSVPHNAAYNLTGNLTLEAWVFPTSFANFNMVITKTTGSGAANSTFELRLEMTTGNVWFAQFTSSLQGITGTTPVALNQWNHIAVVKSGTGITHYLNGATNGSGTITGTPTTNTQAMRIGSRDDAAFFFTGRLDEIAIYNTALSAADIATHYAAGSGTFQAQLSGARVNAVLDIIGWPAADRDVDTGDANIQGGTLDNVSALQHLQEVVDAENGLFFMAGDGDATFVSRTARLSSPYTVSQGSFGDGGGAELLYADIEFDYSDVQLWNEVRITRAGGVEQSAVDTTSQTRYYPRTYSKAGMLMANDAESLAAAQWILGRFKTPALRVQRVLLDGEADPDDLWPHLFGRELGDRVTVYKTPPGGGARIEHVGHIEHIDHTFSAIGGQWSTAWVLSPADLQTYWILQDPASLLGTNTVLAF